MEGGVPMLNCLLQHSLRSLCSFSDSSKWVYAVFWRILPRNYPPPKWDYGGGALDRTKGNKRNWILVWEDGFCDFYECERAGIEGMKRRFGADVFFKMSHEVYSYGEGLVGKVAADNSHKWVFRDSPTENDPSFITSWNVSIDPQPRAWQIQFHSGIQTIAVISVREGLIQLGSFDKISEDINLVISIQRKFSYLLSLPGIYSIQRPYIPIQNPYTLKSNSTHFLIENTVTAFGLDEKRQLTGIKRLHDEKSADLSFKSINLGYNSPQNGSPICSISPLFPSMPCSFGALLSESPFEGTNNGGKSAGQRIKLDFNGGLSQVQVAEVKTEPFCVLGVDEEEEEKPGSLNPQLGLGVELDYGALREGQSAINLN